MSGATPNRSGGDPAPGDAGPDGADPVHVRQLLRETRDLLLRISDLSGESRETAFALVHKYLESVGNRPASTNEICKSAGVEAGALKNLLYTTHKHFFVSTDSPGHKRKKLWRLRTDDDLARPAALVRDMARQPAHECCRRILLEHGNEPMHVLTLAKESIRRGYSGTGKYSGDALEWVTAKSFWARLSRTNHHDFEQVEPNVFRIRPERLPRSEPNLFERSEEEE